MRTVLIKGPHHDTSSFLVFVFATIKTERVRVVLTAGAVTRTSQAQHGRAPSLRPSASITLPSSMPLILAQAR